MVYAGRVLRNIRIAQIEKTVCNVEWANTDLKHSGGMPKARAVEKQRVAPHPEQAPVAAC